MERYEIVADDGGKYCGLIPSENGSVVKYADAQTTVEALQARLQELEEITTVMCGHCCEPMEIPSKAVLQSALTQRTADLEAARVDNRTYINERHENMKQIEQLQADLAERTAELEAAKARQKGRKGPRRR